MSLEAATVAEAEINGPDKRAARVERRGRDRRKPGSRVNTNAPRRSIIKTIAISAVVGSVGVFGLAIASALLVPDRPPPWEALAVGAMLVAFSAVALMLGSIEQRLIEIRLELMMYNGGARQADRRSGGDRRSDTGRGFTS